MSAAHNYLRVLFTRKNGWHFFAYFLVAADKKVRRHQAKQQVKKNNTKSDCQLREK